MEYLRSSEAVVVYPSRADNSPTVVLESAAEGICFLASSTGGVPELFSEEARSTHLFKPNEKDLANKLKQVLTNGCTPATLAYSLQQTRQMQLDWHRVVFSLPSLKTKVLILVRIHHTSVLLFLSIIVSKLSLIL